MHIQRPRSSNGHGVTPSEQARGAQSSPVYFHTSVQPAHRILSHFRTVVPRTRLSFSATASRGDLGTEALPTSPRRLLSGSPATIAGTEHASGFPFPSTAHRCSTARPRLSSRPLPTAQASHRAGTAFVHGTPVVCASIGACGSRKPSSGTGLRTVNCEAGSTLPLAQIHFIYTALVHGDSTPVSPRFLTDREAQAYGGPIPGHSVSGRAILGAARPRAECFPRQNARVGEREAGPYSWVRCYAGYVPQRVGARRLPDRLCAYETLFTT